MKYSIFAIASISAVVVSHAATFQFNSLDDPPDVLIGIRKVGASSEILGFYGPITRFTKAAPGSSFVLTEVSTKEIATVFSSLDGLAITIFGAVYNSETAPGNPVYPTLFVSNPRTNPDSLAATYFRGNENEQGSVANVIASIGDNAAGTSLGLPDGPNNDGTVLVLASNDPNGYSAFMGPTGKFGNTFYRNAELTLPTGFADGGVTVRTDFYQLDPIPFGATPSSGDYIGYFEIGANGSILFKRAGGSVSAPPPVITGVRREGSVTSVTFTTVTGSYSYSLLRAPASGPGAAISQWTTVGLTLPGTGHPLTLTDLTDAEAGFYQVQVIP